MSNHQNVSNKVVRKCCKNLKTTLKAEILKIEYEL